MTPQTVNCAEACVNGCVLGDQCPHRQYLAAASKFIQDTSMDRILEIAEEGVRKKMMEPAQFITDFPD
jgi:hypothetical protein